MAAIKDMEMRLSGGASNTNPDAALGGAMSTVGGGRILSNSATVVDLPGVVLVDAVQNQPGTGTLQFFKAASTMSWQGPNELQGVQINVSGSGVFLLPGVDANAGYVIVNVTFGTLNTLLSDTTDSVTVARLANKLFDDVTKPEALAGDTEYRCFYVQNQHDVDTVSSVKVWIDTDPVGADSFALGLDPAGINGTGTVVASESAAPTGVVFSTPTVGAPLTIGDLTNDDFQAIWVRRTVPAASAAQPLDWSRLKFSGLF